MIVELLGVGRKFNGRWAIRDLSANIQSGSTVAVLGSNGAGKSTLLRLLAGWLPLSAGAILVDKSPMRPTAIHVRRRIMLLDDSKNPHSLPIDTIAQDIQDYRRDRPGIEDEIANWFDKLDVTKVYAGREATLSKGESYKMRMSALFVINPELWLLDEPFSSGLDALGLQTLESQIRQHRLDGGIVVFSSQWPEHARRLADRALVLDEGSLAWEGSPCDQVPAERMTTARGPLRSVLEGLGHAP